MLTETNFLQMLDLVPLNKTVVDQMFYVLKIKRPKNLGNIFDTMKKQYNIKLNVIDVETILKTQISMSDSNE